MDQITSLDGLSRLRDELIEKRKQDARRGFTYLTVGTGTCGIAAGALNVIHALDEEIKAHHLNDIVVAQTGCKGLCRHEPILEVIVGDTPKVAYGRVDPAMVKRIIREHVLEGKVVEKFVIDTTPFPTI